MVSKLGCFSHWFKWLSLLGPAPAKCSRTSPWLMRSVWTPWRTSWRKPVSWLRRLTRNTMRSLWCRVIVVWTFDCLFLNPAVLLKTFVSFPIIASYSIWNFNATVCEWSCYGNDSCRFRRAILNFIITFDTSVSIRKQYLLETLNDFRLYWDLE